MCDMFAVFVGSWLVENGAVFVYLSGFIGFCSQRLTKRLMNVESSTSTEDDLMGLLVVVVVVVVLFVVTLSG